MNRQCKKNLKEGNDGKCAETGAARQKKAGMPIKGMILQSDRLIRSLSAGGYDNGKDKQAPTISGDTQYKKIDLVSEKHCKLT